jgi:anti-sigma factor RsiW
MDCRSFRKHHLAYLDDTLSGDDMTAAQRHILACDRCAAHDTMVRRSLMLARNISMVEPSPEFRDRLRSRLDACKRDDAIQAANVARQNTVFRSPRAFAAIAAGAVLGTIAWSGLAPAETPLVAMQPVIATQPALPSEPYVSPALVQAMATGNPVWPAALILDEMPTQFVNASYTFDVGTR